MPGEKTAETIFIYVFFFDKKDISSCISKGKFVDKFAPNQPHSDIRDGPLAQPNRIELYYALLAGHFTPKV